MSGGLIVAAPRSGSGKTLIVAGLLRHLRQRGIRVAAAKCGPDYVDPTFHALACGAPCINLDPWAMRPETLSALVAGLQGSSELILCEGVMGLFDGAGPDGAAGSTAELARLAGWPVILLVDAAGQGHSVAALIAGFARHDRDVPLAGVILNRIAGNRHEAMLRAAITRHLPDLPVLGALPHDDDLLLESRHLGLVPAGERDHLDALLERAAARIGAGLDLDELIALARPSPGSGAAPASPLPPLGRHIAVARDDAFLFTYEATLAGWRRQGAALSFFSPLANEAPASEADAIYLPGGYPELHAGRLAAATRFRDGLRKAAGAGSTVYGECGGYMMLGETLTAADGAVHAMAGLLPLRTSFAERRRHLGYRAVQLRGACRLGKAGARFRGHEFHYATIIEERGAEPLFRVSDAAARDLGCAGLRRGTVFGSFIHLIDRAEGGNDHRRE